MIEKEPMILEGGPEKFESEPDLNLQLDYVLDSLLELKEKRLLKEEDLTRFLTTRDLIKQMADKKEQMAENTALLKQYRNLIRAKQPE